MDIDNLVEHHRGVGQVSIISDRTLRLSAIGAVVIVASMIFVTWGRIATTSHHGARPTETSIKSEGIDLLPTDTVTDWVTYGDELVEVTVAAVVELPISEGDEEHAYVPRGLVLSVDRSFWKRPSADQQDAPRTLHFQLDGWDDSHGERRQIRDADLPQIEIGHTYVLLLTHLVHSRHVIVDQWAPTSDKAIVPIRDGILNVDDRAARSSGNREPSRTDVRESMTGQDVEKLVSALRSTPVDPAAAPYMGAPADERYQLSMK